MVLSAVSLLIREIHQFDLIYFSGLGTVGTVQSNAADHPAIGDPPVFLRLASHPLRWRLLGELMRSDRAVWELMTLVEEPQSLVSYHLGLLRDGGLVTARRSSADGRDSYYAIDLTACREALRAAGSALHPALRLTPEPLAPRRGRRSHRRQRRSCALGRGGRGAERGLGSRRLDRAGRRRHGDEGDPASGR